MTGLPSMTFGAANRIGAASLEELDAIGERLLAAESLQDALG